MIVTLTPNPSVDRTVLVETLHRGEITRSSRSWSEPSGKGVNVALALMGHGHPATAVLPLGGPAGAHLSEMLGRSGLFFTSVRVSGDVRINISLIEADGTVSKINEPGPELNRSEGEQLLDAARAHARSGDWLAGCGSLPPGLPDDYYAGLVEAGHRVGARVVIDSSGPSLTRALAARPDLIKPNRDELAEAVAGPVDTLGDAVDAAHELRARGAAAVLVSLGSDGVLFAGASTTWHGTAPVGNVISTVGAGDALLAGYLSAANDIEAALATGLRWAAAAVQSHSTVLARTTAQTPVTLTENVQRGRSLS